MQLPKRKSEILAQSKKVQTDAYLTQDKIERLEHELIDLDKNKRPEAIAELRRTQEMGDLSENAAYQEAKWNLRRINSRIMSIQERLKNAIVIEKTTDGTVQIGSTVHIEIDGKSRIFEVVGEQETDPTCGRISFKSPIGSKLIGHKVGEELQVLMQDRPIIIKIIQVD